MSSPAIALPPAPPVKVTKKKAKTPGKARPTVSKLILKAVAASKTRGGLSLAGLKKALKAGGYDVVKNRARIVVAIKRLVANKSLVRTKGSGASGSFKLNKKAPKPRRRVVKKNKKPKAKKAKKAKAKKGASPTKKAAKKKKSKKAAKSPKRVKISRKAKKSTVTKKTTKPKSPKRAKRRVAKSAKTVAAAKK